MFQFFTSISRTVYAAIQVSRLAIYRVLDSIFSHGILFAAPTALLPKPEPIGAAVPLKVIIVGAGLSGLSTAISLAEHGHKVVILESTKEIQFIGSGVGMPPTSIKWFESKGVLKSDDPAWGPNEGFETRRWDTGEVLSLTETSPLANPVSIHRGDLQLALVSRASILGVEIKLASRVIDIDVDSPSVTLAGGAKITGDLVIVADGVNSVLKWKISPSEKETAQPTGDAAYRLILPRNLLENDEDVKALVEKRWIKRWAGPYGQIIAYPVHDKEFLNVVLLYPDNGQAEESWTAVTEKEKVVERYRNWDPVVQKVVALAPDKVPNFKLLTHSPSSAWTKGSAILLGDACHAMPPHLGQGVLQAIEDADAITAVLSLIKTRSQLPTALKAYETSRKGRVVAMQAATLGVRQQVGKDGKVVAHRDANQKEVSEAERTKAMLKAMQASWTWDAGEAARTAYSSISDSAA